MTSTPARPPDDRETAAAPFDGAEPVSPDPSPDGPAPVETVEVVETNQPMDSV